MVSVSRRPKSGSKSRTNNRKSKTVHKQKKQQQQEKHKEQAAKAAAANCTNSSTYGTKQQQHSSTNNIISSKNILEGQKRAKIGFSTVSDLEAPATAAKAAAKKTGSSSNKSNTTNNSKPQKRQQKQHQQIEKQHTTRKASIKQQQKWQNSTKRNNSNTNILEGQKRQGCVFHTTTGARRPECGVRGKPRQIKAKRCGAPGGGGQRPRGNSDTGKSCLNDWKGLQSTMKNNYLHFGRSNTAKVGGEGVRRLAAQKQQQAQAGGVIEGRDPQMCTFGVLGLSCEAPALRLTNSIDAVLEDKVLQRHTFF